MSWGSFRIRLLIVIGAAALLGACEPKRKKAGVWGNAAAATAPEVFALVPAGRYVSIEATRKDKENMKDNEPDCFVWPKHCYANITGFVDGAGEKEPVQALHLDPGVYDVELSYGEAGGDEAGKWRGRLTDVKVDDGGVTQNVIVASPDGQQTAAFVVRLQAEPAAWPDGSICDEPHGMAESCSSEDPAYKCTAGAFTAYGCSKASLYDALQAEICEAKLDMKRSEFAAAFTCSEVAASEAPPP